MTAKDVAMRDRYRRQGGIVKQRPAVTYGLVWHAASLFVFVSAMDVHAQAPGEWVSIGPTTATFATLEVSGRASVIAVNPQNPRDLWIGTASGGVWHTPDAGATAVSWEHFLDDARSQSIGAISLGGCDAQRCAAVLVGTGENNIRRDTYYGMGIYRLDWDPTTTRYQQSKVGTTDVLFGFGSVIDILMKGTDIVVGVGYGKTASASSAILRAPPPQQGFGVFSSSDQGITWTRLGANLGTAVPTDLELSGGRLFAGFLGQGIFVLSPANEWCPLGPGVARPPSCTTPISPTLPNPLSTRFDFVEVAVAPSSPLVMYAAIGRCESETWLCPTPPPLFYRSTDGGDTWIQRTGDYSGIATYSRYTHSLTVNPAFSTAINYGGLYLWKSGDGGGLFWRDSDGNDIHFDVKDFQYPNPSNRNQVYVATDGGISSSDTYLSATNRVWRSLNYGITSIQFYTLCHDLSGTGLLMGGTQDNGTQFFSGATEWEGVVSGDGGFCSIESPEVSYATSQEIAPYRSLTGPNWSGFEPFDSGLKQTDSSTVTPPMVQHPVTRDLFFGTNRLYRRRATEDEWKRISPVFDTSQAVMGDLERRNVITAVAVSRTSPEAIYVGMYDGSVWVTTSCGPCVRGDCWRLVGGPQLASDPLPDAVVTSIEVAPDDAATAYVTYSSFGSASQIWRTKDRGTSWADYSKGLPPVPLKVVRAHPSHPTRLWLGTDSGVYFREGDMMDWTPYTLSQGMPTVPVYDIQVDEQNDRVYAATHGRGVYMLTDTPVLYLFKSWRTETSPDVAIFGYGFLHAKQQPCELLVTVGKEGRPIRVSSVGRPGLATDESGRLRSPLILSGVSGKMALCTTGADCVSIGSMRAEAAGGLGAGIRNVSVVCDHESATASITGLPSMGRQLTSTLLSVRKTRESAHGRFRLSLEKTVEEATDGVPSPHVSVQISVNEADDNRAIAENIRQSIAYIPHTGDYPLRARVIAASSKKTSEDPDATADVPSVSIDIPRPGRGELFTGIRAEPGDSKDLTFTIEDIGQLHVRELSPIRWRVLTPSGGAEGGTIYLSLRSLLGMCTVSVKTEPGEPSTKIASALRDALLGRARDGVMACDSRKAAVDLDLRDDTLGTTLARGMTVRIDDGGVGIEIGLQN